MLSKEVIKKLDYHTVVRYGFEQFQMAYEVKDLALSELLTLAVPAKKFESIFSPADWSKIGEVQFKEYTCPCYFENGNASKHPSDAIKYDVWLNIFLLLSGIQELLVEQRDKHERFPSTASLQVKDGFLTCPAVNVHFEQIAKVLTARGVPCVQKKFEKQIHFSHDIDQIRSGWFVDLINNLKKIKPSSPIEIARSISTKLLGLKDPQYKALERMLSIDEEWKLNAINFVLTQKAHENADYHLEKLVQNEVFARQQIGLHLGFNTANSLLESKKECEQFSVQFGTSPRKVRQHFLKFEMEKTPRIHEELSIEEDHTLGFPDRFGFRNSCCTPFKLFNFYENRSYTVVEIPLFFMDGSLIDYQKDNSWEAKEEVLTSARKVLSHFNSSFGVLFHNIVFNDKAYKDFTKLYLELAKINGH